MDRPNAPLRIVRPYDTDDDFLANELETLGKTGVLLVGAEFRPVGTVLRFEMNLSSGDPLLRGEGRVLAFKENGFRGERALALRFTRLDARSKALLDRAIALRELREQNEPRSKPGRSQPPAVPREVLSIPPAPESKAEPELKSEPEPKLDVVLRNDTVPPVPSTPPDIDRSALLARLRARAAALPRERVEEILRSTPRRKTT